MNNETVVAPNPRLPEKSQRRHRTGRLAALLLVVFVFGSVIVSKANRREAATRFSQESARGKPSVSVVASAAAPAIVDLTLPGNTEAVVVSDIYARATGYVKARYANIGDRVRAGQMLAQIESPELDQELAQAKATLEESRAAWRQAEANVSRAQEGVIEARARLAQSQANEALAATTSERWTRLVEKGVLPRQEGDERQYAFRARKAEAEASAASINTAQAAASAAQAGVVSAQAVIRANEANVQRIQQLVSFERVVAPFDGIITERLVEQGDLVSAGGVAGGRKLFAIAQPSVLRVQMNVPQAFASEIANGLDTELEVRERPGQVFSGKVVRTANALNPSSRTLLVEVQVDNKDGALLPGMFTEVKFSLPRSRPATLIPAEALITNAGGTRVATVDDQGKVRFHTVQVGRDLGTQIEIVAGLQPSQKAILNPGEGLVEGQNVEAAATGKPGK